LRCNSNSAEESGCPQTAAPAPDDLLLFNRKPEISERHLRPTSEVLSLRSVHAATTLSPELSNLFIKAPHSFLSIPPQDATEFPIEIERPCKEIFASLLQPSLEYNILQRSFEFFATNEGIFSIEQRRGTDTVGADSLGDTD
jgi:hypothetical protein